MFQFSVVNWWVDQVGLFVNIGCWFVLVFVAFVWGYFICLSCLFNWFCRGCWVCLMCFDLLNCLVVLFVVWFVVVLCYLCCCFDCWWRVCMVLVLLIRCRLALLVLVFLWLRVFMLMFVNSVVQLLWVILCCILFYLLDVCVYIDFVCVFAFLLVISLLLCLLFVLFVRVGFVCGFDVLFVWV